MTALAELIARLEAATEEACVAWPRKTDKRGRGRILHNGKIMLAHRWVWERINGPIPAGFLLCHTCDNAGCINLRHLYIGTHTDNMRDMCERRRAFGAREPERCREIGRRLGLLNTWARGEGNPKARLTPDAVVEIRQSSAPTVQLASKYGVNRTTIQRVRSGETWLVALKAHEAQP